MPRSPAKIIISVAATAVAALALGASAAGAAKLKLVEDSSLTMSQPNESPRAVVLCPGKREPYGGGMYSTPAPDIQGEGVYPHSYERLGAQSGFHTTPVLFDQTPAGTPGGLLPGIIGPLPGSTRSYKVTLQVLCVEKFGKVSDPHDIALNVPSGTSVTLNAFCPKRTVLIGGGFQRAAFENEGGVYPRESRMVSPTQWQATGTAFGAIKNDMVSIGYCMGSRKRKPLLTEVNSSVAIPPDEVGVTTTPRCSGKRSLISNGFNTEPKSNDDQFGLLFADGRINSDQSFTASGYNNGPTTATLTAYGYCMKNKVIGGSLKKYAKKFGDKISKQKDDQDGNPNG
jgi:hypothetical protein